MTTELPKGRLCQSCGMPLETPDDLGTGADGLRVSDYCRFCFENGVFTNPAMSPQDMIERCATVLAEQRVLPHEQPTHLMTEVIPKLNRWRGR